MFALVDVLVVVVARDAINGSCVDDVDVAVN